MGKVLAGLCQSGSNRGQALVDSIPNHAIATAVPLAPTRAGENLMTGVNPSA